jgi:hypothetical protein
MRMSLSLAALALGGCVVYERAELPRPADPPLAREEAARLLAAGAPEDVLREQVERRGVEPLDADAIAALKKAGASDALLTKMIEGVRVRPPPPEEVIYVERPYWGPSFSFGVGFSSGYRHCRPSRGVRIYR